MQFRKSKNEYSTNFSRADYKLREAVEAANHESVLKLLENKKLRNKLNVNAKFYSTIINEDRIPLLIFAIRSKNLKIVKALIEEGALINPPIEKDILDGIFWGPVEDRKKTIDPLLEAIKIESDEISEFLIKKGAIINNGLFSKDAVIVRAAKNGLTKTVKLLYDKTTVNDANKGMIHEALKGACNNGHFNTVQFFISVHKFVDDYNGVLKYAASSGNTNLVKLLIENGIDLNHKLLAFKEAVKEGNSETAIYLMESVVNIKLEKKELDFLLVKASSKGKPEVVDKLINLGANINLRNADGDSPLLLAIKAKNIETVKMLIEKGADIDANDKIGISPLLWAKMLNDKSIILLLEELGAILNATPEILNLALFEAIYYRLYDAIEVLKGLGADINYKSSNGDTALLLASSRQYADCNLIYKLKQLGADINCRDEYQNTPLLEALYGFANFEIINSLIQCGANVDAQNLEETSPLAGALYNITIFELLLKNNADPNLAKKDGENLLPLIIKEYNNSDLRFIELLVDYGVDVNQKDKNGIPSVLLACDYNKKEILRILVKKAHKISNFSNISESDRLRIRDLVRGGVSKRREAIDLLILIIVVGVFIYALADGLIVLIKAFF